MYFLPFIGIGAPCHSIDSWFSRGPPGLDIGAQEYDAHQRLPSLLGAFDHLAARGSEKAWKGKKTQGEKQPVGWKGNKGVPLPVIHVVQTYPYYKWPYNPAYIYNIYIGVITLHLWVVGARLVKKPLGGGWNMLMMIPRWWFQAVLSCLRHIVRWRSPSIFFWGVEPTIVVSVSSNLLL